MSPRDALLMLGLAVALAATSGCAASGTDSSGEAYYSGRPDEAERRLLSLIERDPESRALAFNELGIIALDRRDLDLAYQRFLEADRVMGAFTSTDLQEVGAIVGPESSKIWRGDPHEKAMNAYYLGIVSLLRGVDDNALAGFKNAIFVDSSLAEAYECDFAPAWFLEGWCYRRLGDESMATRSLARARELAPSCAALAEGNHGNLVVVVDVGRGPTKRSVGAHGEAISFVEHAGDSGPIEVELDGRPLGHAELAGDLFFQATTRGGRVFDYVLAGKAIYKSAAHDAGLFTILHSDHVKKQRRNATFLAGFALLLSSFLMNAEADSRHWTTLPAGIQLFRATVPPGRHEIRIAPADGWHVAGPTTQTIDVPSDGDVFVWQRVLP